MNAVSISQLKVNPSAAISAAVDFPVVVENHGKAQAYLIGKDLYEALVSKLEDVIDQKAIAETDFSKGEDFEAVASELGI